MNKKILFVGYGRAGKDEGAQFLAEHCGLKYGGSTSWAALPLMAEFLKVHPMVAWETRHKNRELWKRQCDEFRKTDPCLLIKRALATGDVITGVRGRPEIFAAIDEKLFDHIVWVHNPRVPVDPTVDFENWVATDVFNNAGTLVEYHRDLTAWALTNKLTNVCNLSSYAAQCLLHEEKPQ